MLNTRQTVWLTAIPAAALGTCLLYSALPGLNWGIWVAATSIGLILARNVAKKTVHFHTVILLCWATTLAFAACLTTVDGHAPLIIATAAILLGLAVTTLDDPSVSITLPSVAQVPFAALSRVAKQAGEELVALPANARGLGKNRTLVAILVAAPIVLILVALLSTADPILDSVHSALLGWMDKWSLDGHIILFIVLSVITLGAYGLAAGERKQLSPPLIGSTPPFSFKRSDTTIILGSVNAVLWTFVVLQLFSLTRNPAGNAGTGLTYAEYARRGFAELSVAAALVLGVILLIEVFRGSENGTTRRRLELGTIFAIELILASAFRRVLLYEAAYGYTTDRLIAQLFMLVLGCAFLLLAWDLSRGAVSAAFGRRGMMLTLAAITAMIYWNYEGWVVRENLERASSGAELDINYLNRLSMNAVPALMKGREKLTSGQRATLDAALRCRKVEKASHWYEWNYRREQARIALLNLGGTCTTIHPLQSSG